MKPQGTRLVLTENKPTYEALKRREEELKAQLEEVRKEIKNVEEEVIIKNFDIALNCLAEIDEMTSGYYRCTIETYCEGCEEDIEVDVDLAEIIEALQQIR